MPKLRASSWRSATSATDPMSSTISSTASAPMADESWMCWGVVRKSLRSTGASTACFTDCRSSGLPPKRGPSVSTEIQDAPPRTYSIAVSAAPRPGRRSPAEGDLRLTSAITASSDLEVRAFLKAWPTDCIGADSNPAPHLRTRSTHPIYAPGNDPYTLSECDDLFHGRKSNCCWWLPDRRRVPDPFTMTVSRRRTWSRSRSPSTGWNSRAP